MKVRIDTNVILAVLLKREPFCYSAKNVLELSELHKVKGYVSSSAITDIYYLAYKKQKDRPKVKELLKTLLNIITVAAVTENEIRNDLDMDWKDFEDSVQYMVAECCQVDCIITRNQEDYGNSRIAVESPDEFLDRYKGLGLTGI